MKKLLLFVMFLISLNSLSEEFKYDNGDRLIVDIVNGKEEGPYKYYAKNGDIEEGTFVNEIIEGPFIKYYTNSGVKEEGTYINSKKEGLTTIYFKDGSKIEGIYKNDKIEGSVKFILPNGINFEIPYTNFQ